MSTFDGIVHGKTDSSHTPGSRDARLTSLEFPYIQSKLYCHINSLNDAEQPVDYFRKNPARPPPLACFLSHVHSDHLQGLESFRAPFIYCSAATGEVCLCKKQLLVQN